MDWGQIQQFVFLEVQNVFETIGVERSILLCTYVGTVHYQRFYCSSQKKGCAH